MGITLNDIAAQRAMLARGEEKRKADWKQAERERLRDTFAAAALPLCTRNFRTAEQIAESAYKLADAMLRERERTNLDAVPEARAETSVKEPMVHATGEPGGEPEGKIGTGKQPAPPCVETDGFSSGSSGGTINRSAERESPRRECGESSLRDVPQLDNSRAAGGPEHHISDRSQPVKDCVVDRSKPISDDRMAALEQLSALDQELEANHGLQGNPMIKAQRNNEPI